MENIILFISIFIILFFIAAIPIILIYFFIMSLIDEFKKQKFKK